jgi:hypothetical protein
MKQPRTLVLMLGRYGDVLNILPWLHHLNAHGKRPVLMVAEQFADIAPHIKEYADVEVWHGDYKHCLAAEQHARRNYAEVQNASVYGDGLVYHRKAQDFCREAWLRAGGRTALDLFNISNGGTIRLSGFDEAYHKQLLEDNGINPSSHTKLILLALNGHSSPIPEEQQWREQVNARLGKLGSVLEIGQLRLRSICDLVAFYRIADLLITSDSAPLHMAGAVPSLPYIALRNDGWGSEWYCGHTRGKCLRKVGYTQASQQRDSILDYAEQFLSK